MITEVADKKYTCVKDTATVYKIRIANSSEWAVITMRQWPKGGSIDIQSDYGNYAYSWCSIGDSDLRDFLLDLEYSYFMGKVRQGQGQGLTFDVDETIAQIKRELLKSRRDFNISKETAHDLWREIYLLEESSQEGFCHSLESTNIVSALYDGDYTSVQFHYKRDPQCDGFWTTIWSVACEVWRDELAKEGVLQNA